MSTSPPSQQLTKGEDTLLSSEGSIPEERTRVSVLTVFEYIVTFIGNKYQLDKPQAYLVVTLLILIVLSCVFVLLVWKFYSRVILDFSVKERRTRKEKNGKRKEE